MYGPVRIKRDKLEKLKASGKASLVAAPAEKVEAAPKPVADTPPKLTQPSKKKWRFDVNRDMEGYITNVMATEL